MQTFKTYVWPVLVLVIIAACCALTTGCAVTTVTVNNNIEVHDSNIAVEANKVQSVRPLTAI
ncbi:hypothetical protein CJ97_gp09 [Ralstonia phage RSB2]|uniref:Uncharacterized protein ORF9 n=1 Tax=Ralstonia phage RSB2 TaxID=913183 RepID=E5RUY9_9CAUD|nr:hypothetical protein CJ97_gp09 [Ralstonia phage RSB2]BAJ51797.1 hypothetical protein [Ralstonia phage RSB2]